MNSRERMLAALEYREVDYTPCSFMLFFNLCYRSGSAAEVVEKQVEMGLDAYVGVGHLNHSLHPEAHCHQWVEEVAGTKVFHRRIDTPKGPLTTRVVQDGGWPREDHFPLFNDCLIARTEEVLVKPEQDLEKLGYIFGPFRDEDIEQLRQNAHAGKKLADRYDLLQVGGWAPTIAIGPVRDRPDQLAPVQDTDSGVMGCDAMSWLSGYEEVMMLSLTRPDIVKEYAQIIHEWNMRQIGIYLDVTDADIIWRRAWYETTEFWTPDAFRNIVAPTIKREVELVHQAGRKYGYIITSSFMPILSDILDTGIDVLIGLDPEEGKGTGLTDVKQEFASRRKAIWGGVSGAITVELGTADETEQAVRTALTTLGADGGFILSPVDNVREDTENAWRNTQIFIDTWKRLRSD